MAKSQKSPPKDSKPGARERILATALDLFYSKGIRATGIDTIIAESGVAKMTFYSHFGSKQNLVLEVLKRGEELWFEMFEAAIAQKKDPRAKLLGVFDFLGKWFQDPRFRGCAYINAAAESADRGADECTYSAAHKQRVATRIEQLAREAGYDKTAAEIGQKFLLLMDGATVRALMDAQPSAKPALMARSIAELALASAR